jgi:hypothetical protein
MWITKVGHQYVRLKDSIWVASMALYRLVWAMHMRTQEQPKTWKGGAEYWFQSPIVQLDHEYQSPYVPSRMLCLIGISTGRSDPVVYRMR